MADTEELLLARLRSGEKQALGDLFALHQDRLWRIVHFRLDRRLNGRLDTDDVLQEAYLAAAQRLHHFLEGDENHSFFVWLRLIVCQTLIDLHREHLGAKMRNAALDVPLQKHRPQNGTSVSLVLQLLGNFTSPSQAAMRQELAGQLEEALESMNPIDREVLALRHFEELTNSEVAEVLEIQPKAASIRYVRAIKRLKEILENLPGFERDPDSLDV